MSVENEKQVGLFVKSLLASKNKLSVVWHGGEPLIQYKTIQRLSSAFLRMCSLSGVRYHSQLFTNGILLTKNIAKDLASCGIHSVRISIDGPADIHNMMRPGTKNNKIYDQIMTGLENALNYFPTVMVSINMDKRNINHVEKLLYELASKGFTKSAILFCRITDHCKQESYNPDNFLTVEEFAGKETTVMELAHRTGFPLADSGLLKEPVNFCGANALNHFAVEPFNIVKKCWCEVGDPAIRYGTIRDGVLLTNPSYELLIGHIFEETECLECLYLPICYGGCPRKNQTNYFSDADYKQKWICTSRRYNLKQLLKTGVIPGGTSLSHA